MSDLVVVAEGQIFNLTNRHFSYVFRVSPEGILEHVYYGPPLIEAEKAPIHNRRVFRHVAVYFENKHNYSLGDTPQECPTHGRSDYRFPALQARGSSGHSIFTLRYDSHKIVADKPSIEGLPTSRGGNSETLIVTLKDTVQNVSVELSYTIYDDYGVLCRSTKITNKGSKPVRLEHLFSSTIELPKDDYEILHLHGTWATEFNEERLKIPSGRFTIDSSRGTSGFAHHPFVAVMENGATEERGEVFASTLMYSGNFQMSVEKGEMRGVRILSGLNPYDFEWHLTPGESFSTPEALHVYSGEGLRNMSEQWHDFIQNKISPPQFKGMARPTYLNSWESTYFDIDEDKVLSLADKAKHIGVDMLVLDDGWFEGRTGSQTSLGDWFPDKKRFPSGIDTLAKRVKAKGVKFGLWIEPEMVSRNSDLYRSHPDWVIHVPDVELSQGRNQYTLDLSRDDVVDYLFGCIDGLLSCGDIDYVKWDMNRPMSEVGSALLPPERQGEVAHRYMLGLYRLLGRLTQKYPKILFENCASGGNRFDLGMLHYMPQGWISDMSDPIGRLQIISGASYLYPMDTMSAYICPSPNHQNGRDSSIETRFMAGVFCASRGLSLSNADLTEHEAQLQSLMAWSKETAADMVGGAFHRIFNTQNQVCWQFSEKNGERIYLVYFHILAGVNKPFERAKLVGLDNNSVYKLTDRDESYRGDALMRSGMPLPYFPNRTDEDNHRYMPHGDFSSYLMVFKR